MGDWTGEAHPQRDRLALGIQQPWAELILRGEKTLEVRSSPTRVLGTVYLYASRRPSPLECAAEAAAARDIQVPTLTHGRILGLMEIVACRRGEPGDTVRSCVPGDLLAGRYVWEIGRVHRFDEPLEIRFLPYGIWFYPFRRKNAG